MGTTHREAPAAWERRIGGHVVRFEPPNLFYIAVVGDVAVQEAAAILSAQDEVSNATERFFVLFDATRAGTLELEVRKITVARNSITTNLADVAVVGASFRMRVLLTLISKALALTRRATVPIAFFDAEADARAWLDAHRAGKSAAP